MRNENSKGSAKNRCFKIFLFLIVLIFYFIPSPLFSASPPNRKIIVAFPDGRSIETDVVETPDLRSSGLMGRSRLKINEGMLFIFETDDLHMMWMKNMAISIDMVWLNEKKEVIAMTSALPPCRVDPCPIYGPSAPSRYVLEISAGASAVYRLREGMKLKFP